jgi:hypothetical protein
MPLSHVSKSYGTRDAKIAPLTADPAGGTATYGALIDVPGIKSVTIGGSVNEKQLRGDHQLLDTEAIIEDITITFDYAKLSQDVLDVLMGGTITDAGTTPTQTATYALLGTDSPGYFRFEAQVAAADTVGGDVHLVLYKCKITGIPDIGTAEEDFKTFSVSARAVPRLADSKWMDVVFNETAAAIA